MSFPVIDTWLVELDLEISQTTLLYTYCLNTRPTYIVSNGSWCKSTVRCQYFETLLQLLTITQTGLRALNGGDREVFSGMLQEYTEKLNKRLELAAELTDHQVLKESEYLNICNNAKICFEYFKNVCLYGENNA